jgi:hypothetical protein
MVAPFTKTRQSRRARIGRVRLPLSPESSSVAQSSLSFKRSTFPRTESCWRGDRARRTIAYVLPPATARRAHWRFRGASAPPELDECLAAMWIISLNHAARSFALGGRRLARVPLELRTQLPIASGPA